MPISAFPRVRLAHLPTPLEPMERLANHLGGPELYIKRDDCTGLATGGNKTRKLEYLVADALRQGADTILTAGAVQSNHVRQAAAAAARAGLACHALLEREVRCEKSSYRKSGNVLLDDLLGCRIDYCRRGTDLPGAMRATAQALRAQGHKPYLVPVGGSNAVGSLGYVQCANEISEQCRVRGVPVTRLIHATGSGGTQAGLLAGFYEARQELEVIGISVSADRPTQRRKVRRLAGELWELMGLGDALPAQAVQVRDEFVGEGYGLPTDEMLEAVQLCARLEGILLDPVYSGKAMAGLIHMVRSGELNAGDTVVFLHTGGAAGLFAYDWYLGRS